MGTGFDQRTMRDLRARLDPLVDCEIARSPRSCRSPGVTWVKPELVCAVKYANWTPDNRLRAPVYQGLRNDVDPLQVRREVAGDASRRPA